MREKHFITGGAGFIGSSLVDRLLELGHQVIIYDNLSTGQERFLEKALSNQAAAFIKADILDFQSLSNGMRSADMVWHLAANADVRSGLKHPRRDMEQNTIGTANVLEAMRENGINRIAFSSTSAVYGEPELHPIPEDAPFPVQTSLYGASKAAAEGLIEAYSLGYDMQSYIFRFVSVLGARYTHGHVFDFCRQLLNDSRNLTILGNGHQTKSYMHIDDCLDAMLLAVEKATERINIFNLGVNDYTEVNDSVKIVIDKMDMNPSCQYTGGIRGWIGDNLMVWLDTRRISALGWQPKIGIREAVASTVDWLMNNKWAFNRKD
jgi:UDP-glucose 4-epimerase